MGIKKREIRACCSPAIKGSSIAHTVRRTTLEAHADMNIYITAKHLYKTTRPAPERTQFVLTQELTGRYNHTLDIYRCHVL